MATTAPNGKQQTREQYARKVPRVERLVTIESQKEFDLLTGEEEERIFLKLYVAAREIGLLSEISDRDWKTLCVIATFMDFTGYCYPSQDTIAKALGVNRATANRRIKSLSDFRFRDKPVLLVTGKRRKKDGTYGFGGYRVLPLSSLSIFKKGKKKAKEDEKETPQEPEKAPPPTMCRDRHMVPEDEPTMCRDTNMVNRHTNKNHLLTRSKENSKFRKVNQQQILEKGREESPPASPASGAPGSGRRQFEAVGESLKGRAPAPPAAGKEPSASDREILTAFWEPLAPEMRDSAPYSTVTELLRYFEQSNLEKVTDMMPVIYEARAITKERTSSIRNGKPGARNMVPYFKSVVRDKLGLKKKSQDKKDDDSAPAETPP